MRFTVTDDIGATAGRMLADALSDGGRLAVPGGGSPRTTFQWLARNADTALWRITWVDERHAATPQDSNYQALVQTGLRARFVSMERPGTLDEAVRDYTRAFQQELGGLDAVLLGMGPDGHIASLFPGHPALDAAGICVGIADSPKPPPQRLTLTLPVLDAAPLKVLVCTGAAKGAALEAARHDPSLPLARLTDLHVVLDAEAASELT